jgi:hydrogenase maturation protease
MSEPRILVLGIGNILLRDEGVGVHVVNRFRDVYTVPEGVALIDGGTMGLDLIPYFEDRTHVIVVDAVCANGQRPGTIHRFSGSDVMGLLGERISPHQIGLSDLLACIAVGSRLPEQLVLLGIVPESLETGLEMTATVQGNLDKMVGVLREELRAAGVIPVPKDSPPEGGRCMK